MEKKAKRIVVHAELRKESQAFDGYLKYEITVKNEEGEIERIPAYGKDLQDALSRVVHDEIVEKIESKVIKKIPETGWAFAWFLGLTLIVLLINTLVDSKSIGLWFIGTIFSYAFGTLSVSNWFKLRNKSL